MANDSEKMSGYDCGNTCKCAFTSRQNVSKNAFAAELIIGQGGKLPSQWASIVSCPTTFLPPD